MASVKKPIIISLVVPMIVTAASIAIQQTLFRHFVAEVGGRPDGLFRSLNGAYYELWSFTAPFWATNVLMALTAFCGARFLRRKEFGWRTLSLWLAYVASLWSMTVASSGLVQILGEGEVFI
jgi:hypothetical protein